MDFYVESFDDYHEIDWHAEDVSIAFKNLGKGRLKSQELGYRRPLYYGLFWNGKKPSKAMIEAFLQKKFHFSLKDFE